MLKKVIKRIIREKAWKAKKKTIIQILTPRCRQDGLPECGRLYTEKDHDCIISSDNMQIIMHNRQ